MHFQWMLELRSLTTNYTERRIMSNHSDDFNIEMVNMSDLYEFKWATVPRVNFWDDYLVSLKIRGLGLNILRFIIWKINRFELSFTFIGIKLHIFQVNNIKWHRILLEVKCPVHYRGKHLTASAYMQTGWSQNRSVKCSVWIVNSAK